VCCAVLGADRLTTIDIQYRTRTYIHIYIVLESEGEREIERELEDMILTIADGWLTWVCFCYCRRLSVVML
jgi:hypothetical protein